MKKLLLLSLALAAFVTAYRPAPAAAANCRGTVVCCPNQPCFCCANPCLVVCNP